MLGSGSGLNAGFGFQSEKSCERSATLYISALKDIWSDVTALFCRNTERMGGVWKLFVHVLR